MKRDFETIILGAGASGLMCAAFLPRKRDVLIIDSNPRIARKLSISGGGRCNFSNRKLDPSNYFADENFTARVLERFGIEDLLEWLRHWGLEYEIRKNGQYFCAKSAEDMVSILRDATKEAHFMLATTVVSVSREHDIFEIHTDKGVFRSKKVVVATGSPAWPSLGSSSIGVEIAESFGHKCTRFVPALTGFTLQPEQFFFKELSGVSVDVVIELERKRIEGALLFAHRGISGPAVLNASLWWRKGEISIDFAPGFEWGPLRRSSKNLATLMPLPRRVAVAFLKDLGIENGPARHISRAELAKLETLNRYRFSPAGRFGFVRAEVARGGVLTDGIDPDTMMSCIVDNLFFTGEAMDVTGEVGGYNIHWAFGSAYVCAQAVGRDGR